MKDVGTDSDVVVLTITLGDTAGSTLSFGFHLFLSAESLQVVLVLFWFNLYILGNFYYILCSGLFIIPWPVSMCILAYDLIFPVSP